MIVSKTGLYKVSRESIAGVTTDFVYVVADSLEEALKIGEWISMQGSVTGVREHDMVFINETGEQI